MTPKHVTICVGLPASGKSTWAREFIKGNRRAYRLNKDDIRNMVGSLDQPYHHSREALCHDLFMKSIDTILLDKDTDTLVMDNTHLNPKTYQSIVDHVNRFCFAHGIKHTIEVKKFDTPLVECLERDDERMLNNESYVGAQVILNMAYQYGVVTQDRPIIVCDIDGTLFNIDKRRKISEKPDGKIDFGKFFDNGIIATNDEFRQDVKAILIEEIKKTPDAEVILVSGRAESTRNITQIMLDNNGIHWVIDDNHPSIRNDTPDGSEHVFYRRFIMRSNHDYSQDDVLKERFLNNYMDKTKIVCAIDDRPRIIRMWQKNNIRTVDVGNGIEF